MPAYSSHYIFAKEMMEPMRRLNGGHLCEDAVYFGTQGPDVFFFHRSLPTMPGRSCRKVGSALHRAKPSAIFDSMARYVRDRHYDITALSYAYGFICHYALDRVVHPLVYSIQHTATGRHGGPKGFTVHNAVEFSLDNAILNQKLGLKEPWLFRTADTVPRNEDVIERISEMLNYVIPVSTELRITKGQISQAMRDTRTMQRATNDQTGRKTMTIKTAETLLAPVLMGYKISVMIRPRNLELGYKFLNERHGVWENPSEPGKKRRESFFELYDRAKEECIVLLEAFSRAVEEGVSMSEITEERSFLTGMPVE